jgi:hypothetical protein
MCECPKRSVNVEYYCKECRVYLCDGCVFSCKKAHPTLVLDQRVMIQRGLRRRHPDTKS